MIRIIYGKKGSGKTKQMIEMINSAVQTEHGNVVCIEKGNKLTFDLPTDAGHLNYLRGQSFTVENVPFRDKYFG